MLVGKLIFYVVIALLEKKTTNKTYFSRILNSYSFNVSGLPIHMPVHHTVAYHHEQKAVTAVAD
jgi:hypothetical protein